MTAIAEQLPPGLERPGWSLTGAEALAELDALHEAQTRLAARRLELLGRVDELGHARELGARDTVELISLRHRLDPQAVRRDLRTARTLPRHPAVARQLTGYPAAAVGASTDPDGVEMFVERRRLALARETVLNAAQAEVIAEVLAKVPASVPAADLAVAETELVIAARTLTPRDLRRLGRGVLHRLDIDGSPPDETAAASEAAQTLWFTPGTSISPSGLGGRVRGLRFGGFLTGETAELFQTLIDAGAKPRKTPSGELDPRTLGQRRADAFAIVLRAAAANGGEIPPHGGIKPQLSITMEYADLVDATKKAGTAPQIFGEPLPASDVRRIACDADIIPIVLGAASEPLDVGREHRLVTPAIRRALIARDGGCVIPGCGAPPGHCDAHHVIHWIDGGETSVGNLALVCTTHHRAIHRGIWTVTITNGQVQITRPDWTEPGPSG